MRSLESLLDFVDSRLASSGSLSLRTNQGAAPILNLRYGTVGGGRGGPARGVAAGDKATFLYEKEMGRRRLFPIAVAADRARLCLNMRTVGAVIQPNDEVVLVEPVRVPSPRRALVIILEEALHLNRQA